MTIKLSKRRGDKPCPFCGKMDAVVSGFHLVASVECMRCSASGPIASFCDGTEAAAEKTAVDLWNKRAEMKQPTEWKQG